MTTVVVVDDHAVVAHGTASLLKGSGLEVTGVATDLDAAVDVIVRTQPDVVVCDVMLGDQPGGLDLPRRLRERGLRTPAVLLLSSYDAPFFLARALSEGAVGYLLKSAQVPELVSAIEQVAAGGTAFTAAALRTALTHREPTAREREVIELVAAGAANGEIAGRLGISDKTVETYIARLFLRYGVASRTELAMYAIAQGWLPSQVASSALS